MNDSYIMEAWVAILSWQQWLGRECADAGVPAVSLWRGGKWIREGGEG